MKIEINLDETRFKNLVDDELESFTREEIHDILQSAMEQYIMEKDVIGNIFYTKKRDWSGNETGEVEPTYRLNEIIKGLDMEPTLKRLKKDVEKVLQENGTIQRLAENVFYRFLSDRINEMIWQSSSLQNIVRINTNQILDDRLKC